MRAQRTLQRSGGPAAAEARSARGKVPLAIQILCLVWAAFVIAENVGEFMWIWPTGSSLPGGYLGLDASLSGALGDGYLRVVKVQPGAAAANAGIQAGDAVRFDRRSEFGRRLRRGETVGLTLVHAGRARHVQLTAGPRILTPDQAKLYPLGPIYSAATGLGALFGAFIIWRSRRNPTTLLLGMAILDYGMITIAPPLWASGPRLAPVVYALGLTNLMSLPVLFYAFAIDFHRDCVGPGKAWERIVFWLYALVMGSVGVAQFVTLMSATRLPIVGDVETLGLYATLVGLAACFAYLVLGWRRSSAALQQRYALMLVATAAIILAQAMDSLTSVVHADLTSAHFLINTVLTAVIAYPLFAYAILRHRVFDLGFAVNRTLVYGVVSAILLAAFGLVEWGVDHFVPIQGREKNALFDAGLALGVFLVFHRVRDTVERGVEALFFRSWQKAEAQLRRFVRDAAFVRSPDALARTLAGALGRFAEGTAAALYLVGEDGRPRLAADAGWASAPGALDLDDPALVALRAEPRPLELEGLGSALPATLIAPMVNRNEVFGLVLLGAKPGGLAYRPDEKELIGWATRQVGLDLHALRIEQLEADKADLAKTVAVLEHALSLKSAAVG